MNLHDLRAAGLLAAAASLFALAASAPARADTVTEWNAIATSAIVTTAGQPPHAAPLSLAMVHGAVYDAVNAIERGHQPYLVAPRAKRRIPRMRPPRRRPTACSPRCSRPSRPRSIRSIARRWRRFPAGRGRMAGSRPATRRPQRCSPHARTTAGRAVHLLSGAEPGAWRPTPPTFSLDPAPWVGTVRPFLVPTTAMLRSDPPNALTSAAYAKDFREVKRIGALTSRIRSADQTEAAIFWQDHGPALWNRVFRDLSASHALDMADSARLFAMANLAAADGAIGCWHSKARWSFWRPITAIREAGTDGNRATRADPAWTPLFDPATPQFGTPLVTPGFPDHPSGHACVSGAIVSTLKRFFGTDQIAFSAFSNRTRTARSFDRLSDALEEIVDARVWGGIHFRAADDQGAVLGKKVAHWLGRHYFRRAH